MEGRGFFCVFLAMENCLKEKTYIYIPMKKKKNHTLLTCIFAFLSKTMISLNSVAVHNLLFFFFFFILTKLPSIGLFGAFIFMAP